MNTLWDRDFWDASELVEMQLLSSHKQTAISLLN